MMRRLLIAAILSAASIIADTASLPRSPPSSEYAPLQARALPANAPHGYTPQVNNCPSNPPIIRDASTLSEEESSWLDVRRKATVKPMRDLLSRLNIKGLDTDQYINNHRNNVSSLPNIGIALSGGGYRAMLNGAGVVEAFDSRTPNSTSAGQLGGLLQSSTYIAGLSGGSWLVGSLYANNFPSINSILAEDTSSDNSGDLWQLGNSIFEGPDTGGVQLFDSVGYYSTLVSNVDDKKDAGFNITLTDLWGRALSFQFINATNGGPAYTWSSIADQEWFTSGTTPMPFLVADGRKPGETLVSSNATVFSFSPFFLGSEDPTIYAFAPLKYVGSNFTAGTPTTDQCVTGFDMLTILPNVGYVYGTSSSLFNTLLTNLNGMDTTGLFTQALQDLIASILKALHQHDNDIADYPNPFYAYNNDTNPYAYETSLTLVDGGEDLQNIPLHPLIQPYRHVDVIFAVDSSADTNKTLPVKGSALNWPDGASLVASYERSQSEIGNGTAFPAVPDIHTFFNLGLNNKPTFFGCDASNLTGPSPFIVYLPNAPYIYNSNYSTFQLAYNDTERNAIVSNGYNLATQGNGTLDDQWPTCVGCAILSRSLDRTGTSVPEVCKQCFNRYCWDGTTDSRTPNPYIPKMKLGEVNVKSGGVRLTTSTTCAVALGVITVMLLR